MQADPPSLRRMPADIERLLHSGLASACSPSVPTGPGMLAPVPSALVSAFLRGKVAARSEVCVHAGMHWWWEGGNGGGGGAEARP